MVDGEGPASLSEKIRRKISALKPAVPEQHDEERPKNSKKCPMCNTEYPRTDLVVCPRDRTMLLTPESSRWTWFEFAKNDDTSVQRCPKCEGIFTSNNSFSYVRCPSDQAELQPVDFLSMTAPILENRYQLLSYLGEDNLFESFLARDLTDSSIVSVGFLTNILSLDPKTVSHFLKLGKTAIGLTHPNLLSVYSLNVTADAPSSRLRPAEYPVPYSVSEYVISNSLDAEIKARRWFDPASAARIFIDILSALSYAHDRGVTHGAISTGNLRVAGGIGSRGKGLMSNFGLAERLLRDLEWDQPSTNTRTSSLYGDPDGLCPEFCHGRRQTVMTDQYQIGCALYETLCGRPPFERPATTQILLAHMRDEPDDISTKNSEVPAQLIKVLLKCLQKNPEDRYPSAQALSDELQQFLKP